MGKILIGKDQILNQRRRSLWMGNMGCGYDIRISFRENVYRLQKYSLRLMKGK